MDRGVVIGGALICASFLLAIALNHSEVEPKSPAKRYEPLPELSIDASAAPPRACTTVPKEVPDTTDPVIADCK